MKRVISLLSFILLAVFNTTWAQYLPTIVPPSPEATSLAKFTEVPISHYTGLPSINIPIYTIEQKGISIPISLSYHARGIQVGEIAPRVGLGWALNCGGMISRQTRGIEDESYLGYLNGDYYKNIFTEESVRNNIWAIYCNAGFDFDFEPDIFSFNINGSSGKFVFDQRDKKPVLQKFDDIEITYTIDDNGKIASFIIKDKYGNKYYFGISKDGFRNARDEDYVDKSFVKSQPGYVAEFNSNGDRFYNSWHLMEIETPDNGKIEFMYDTSVSIYYRRSYDNINRTNGSVLESYFSKIISNQYQITEIIFDNSNVVFTKSSTPRQDLSGDCTTLDKIEVFNKFNQLIKGYKLQYEYVVAPDDNNQLNYLKDVDPAAKNRLFLKTIQEKYSDQDALPPYRFEYNTIPLPNRFSNSQDLWGYYNGADNGQFLTFYNYGMTSIDRTVDTIKSGAGILSKINYPTGGNTSFTYEQNKAIPTPVLRDLVIANTNPAVLFTNGLSNLEHIPYYTGGIYEKEITIGPNLVGHIDFNIWFTNELGCSSSSPMPGCDFEVSIHGPSGHFPLFIGESFANLTPGVWTLKVFPNIDNYDPTAMEHGFYIGMNWNEQLIGQNEMIYAGGKRIKRIDNSTSDGIATSKEYKYIDASGNCSGKLFALPNFKSIKKTVSSGGLIVSDFYGSIPGSPLNVTQGNNVGYSNVTEYIGDAGKNIGKTEYEFNIIYDAGMYYEFPYNSPTDNEWLRGKPLSIKYFNYKNNKYILQKEIKNEYSIYFNIADFSYLDPEPQDLYLKTRTLFYLPLIIFKDMYGNYKTYFFTGGTSDLMKQDVIDYYDNGITLAKNTEDVYNYDNHYQVKETTTTTSEEGKVVQIKTHYPADVASTSSLGADLLTDPEKAAIDKLKVGQQHRLAEPIQVEKIVKDAVGTVLSTSIQRTNYIDTINMVLPVSVQTLNGNYNATSNKLEDRIIYHRYDFKGNPLEVSKADGPHITYIWGYNSIYSIAETKNATTSECDYTGFENHEAPGWAVSRLWYTDDPLFVKSGRSAVTFNGNGPVKTFNVGLAANSHSGYKASAWIKGGTDAYLKIEVVGQSAYSKLVNNPNNPGVYNLLEVDLPYSMYKNSITSGTQIKVSTGSTSNAAFDDLRFYPSDAQMASYTYDPLIGVTSVSDVNNKPAIYKYDTFNRLWFIKDFQGNTLKKYVYHYKP